MKTFFLLLFSVCVFITVNGQDINSIKNDKNYIWGEGSAETLKNADADALSQITSQISIQVESKFEQIINQSGSEKKIDFKQQVNSIVNTYSNVALSNVGRIVIANEPEAHVFRYIKKADVFKIFEQRRLKIIQFADDAVNSASNGAIADALKYYYWSLMLLRSHPESNEIKFKTPEGQEKLLCIWLPAQINAIFSAIKIRTLSVEGSNANLVITFNDKAVSNFDYSYWDGRDWAEIVSAKDGVGVAELASALNSSELNVKAEYMFDIEARSDRELEEVIRVVPPVPFKNCYFKVSLNPEKKEEKQILVAQQSVENNTCLNKMSVVKNNETFTRTITKVLSAIALKQYESVKPLFSDEGFAVFSSLIHYGNASLVFNPDLKFYSYNGIVCARSTKFKFSFPSCNKSFVEDIVFHFNSQGLIDDLTFALDKKALEGITTTTWPENEKMVCINFLEHFKTAYALKQLEYIASIFDDNALIITGKVIKEDKSINDFSMLNSPKIKYSKQTKAEYIKNLKLAFLSKEYINLKFEECAIEQGGPSGKMYGINLAQRYFSSNYGDFGYLFLLVDLNDIQKPLIHVRTWQPTKDSTGRVWTMADF